MSDYIVGIDVGGTTVKMAIFTTEGENYSLWEIVSPSREEADRKLWPSIADSIKEKFAELGLPYSSLKAAGIGLPGPIYENGYLPRCVNLGLGACHPAELLGNLLGVPVKAGNDANVAALGEVHYGAAKGYENAALFTLGTGVGGGIVVKGHIVAGNHGVGGEVGHFVVNPYEETACNCGNHGCLEQYASATGIVRTVKKLLESSNEPSALRQLDEVTAKDVCDEARNGDAIALKALECFGKYMGLAMSYVQLTSDPDIMLLGGGVSRAGQILLDVIEKYLCKYTHIAEKHAKLAIATLGNDAGTYGAAALAISAM